MSVFSSLQTFFKGNRLVGKGEKPKSSKRHLPEGTYNKLVQIFDMDAESLHASRKFFETGTSKNHEIYEDTENTVENTPIEQYENTDSSPKMK